MNWRIQKDDPIEDCEEAKYAWVWVVLKKDSWYPRRSQALCRLTGPRYTSVQVMDTYQLFLETNEISYWQLISTPAMPFRPTEEEVIDGE